MNLRKTAKERAIFFKTGAQSQAEAVRSTTLSRRKTKKGGKKKNKKNSKKKGKGKCFLCKRKPIIVEIRKREMEYKDITFEELYNLYNNSDIDNSDEHINVEITRVDENNKQHKYEGTILNIIPNVEDVLEYLNESIENTPHIIELKTKNENIESIEYDPDYNYFFKIVTPTGRIVKRKFSKSSPSSPNVSKYKKNY